MNKLEKWEENCSVLKDHQLRSKYLIQENIIGEGSFGTVLTAKCRATQEIRALKIIRRIEKVSMLDIELQLLVNLGGHFNIVKFYDFFHIMGSVAIVMEHFPHYAVSELVMNSRRDPSFALLYFRNLLTAISYLHQNKFVHRDIKLSNFLYSPQLNSFRLVDFGLATIDRSENEAPRSLNQRALLSYQECETCQKSSTACMQCKAKPKRDVYHVVGTPGVRAPELLLGVGICSPPVDIFSAGLCLLSLITLKHPFFMPKDEADNIANLACLLGTKTMENVAAQEGIILTLTEDRRPADLCRFIMCLRYGFETVYRCKEFVGDRACEVCAKLSFNNPLSVCFCRPNYETGRFATDGIKSDLLVLYVDLLSHALEPDRFKRYSAQKLLGLIDFYDSRANYVPKPFTDQDP